MTSDASPPLSLDRGGGKLLTGLSGCRAGVVCAAVAGSLGGATAGRWLPPGEPVGDPPARSDRGHPLELAAGHAAELRRQRRQAHDRPLRRPPAQGSACRLIPLSVEKSHLDGSCACVWGNRGAPLGCRADGLTSWPVTPGANTLKPGRYRPFRRGPAVIGSVGISTVLPKRCRSRKALTRSAGSGLPNPP